MDPSGWETEPRRVRPDGRQALRRLRWRLRGAWQWPAFIALTLVDGVVLAKLPFYEAGPGSVLAGVLLSGFANLFAVAVLAPLAARALRRRRPDLPRLVARDYAGTALVAAIAVLLLGAGLAHRPAAAAADADRRAVLSSVHDYVLAQAPELRAGIPATDAMRLEERLYRACVPRPGGNRWLCLIVSTDQRPPGVTRDRDEVPNAAYRLHGGFR
jgi:hypothetical protein